MSQVEGIVCFESAYGKYLCVEPDGKVVADRAWECSWEQFRLEQFTDPGTSAREGGDVRGTGYDHGGVNEVDECNASRSKGDDPLNFAGSKKVRNRFALRTYHGQYLR